VNYYVRDDPAGEARITVTDLKGRQHRQMTSPARRGLNRTLIPLGARGGRGGELPRGGSGESEALALTAGEYAVAVEVRARSWPRKQRSARGSGSGSTEQLARVAAWKGNVAVALTVRRDWRRVGWPPPARDPAIPSRKPERG
jgi:hypothetical protein